MASSDVVTLASKTFDGLELDEGGRLDPDGILHVAPIPYHYAARWAVAERHAGPAMIVLEVEVQGGDIGILCVDDTMSDPVTTEVMLYPGARKTVQIEVSAFEKVKAVIIRKGPVIVAPALVRFKEPVVVRDAMGSDREDAVSAPSRVTGDPETFKQQIELRAAIRAVETGNQMREVVSKVSKSAISAALADDPWLRNYALNWWEYYHKCDVLSSYPWQITLPVADLCNARCTFCTSWLSGKKVLAPQQVERYAEVLPFARNIGIQGHGEPLANPHIDLILKRIAELADPRAEAYIITNGMFLARCLQGLLDARVTAFNFSLNAATNATHNIVMGLGETALDNILDGIRKVIAQPARVPRIQTTISMVLTRDNMHEAADFIRLGNELGVSRIYLRSLMPAGHLIDGLNYHLLPPSLHPDFIRLKENALEAAAQSTVPIEMQPETWHLDALPASLRKEANEGRVPFIRREEAIKNKDIRGRYKEQYDGIGGIGRFLGEPEDDGFDPYGRSAPFRCQFIYQQLITTTLTFRAVPCCYMPDVPGHESVVFDGTRPFMDYWNSDAFVTLRRTLRDGPLLGPCRTCPMQG